MNKEQGVIYILTNPSFPEYVKIGYADEIEKRLKQLNRSECIPFAFRVYATYEVESRLSDLKIHDIIDRLNPTLRAIDNFDGKKRVREFYAMTAEDAYSLLEAIADIHDLKHKLKKIIPNEQEAKAEQIASEIEIETKERRENFSFEKCGIAIGSELAFVDDESQKCYVISDRMVEYQGEKLYLTGLAKKLKNTTMPLAGPHYFTYQGEILSEIRLKIESQNNG